MSKIAFCFPGQGSIEAGMGHDIAEAVPEARTVFERSSAASGLDLERLCFHGDAEELVDTAVQQPALVATSLAMLAAMRERGIEPDFVVGHSVGEFAALAAAEAMSRRGGDRARARARPRDGGGGGAASRLDGRDPRARGRGRRDALPADPRRVAGELQLPRARSSSPARTSPSTSASSARRRRARAAP